MPETKTMTTTTASQARYHKGLTRKIFETAGAGFFTSRCLWWRRQTLSMKWKLHQVSTSSTH